MLRALSQGQAEPDKGEFTDSGALTQDAGFNTLARPQGVVATCCQDGTKEHVSSSGPQ